MTVNQLDQTFVEVGTAVPEHPEANVIAQLRQYVSNYFTQNNLTMQPGSEDAAMVEQPDVPDRRQYRFVCTTTCGRKFYFSVQSDKQDNVVDAPGHFELDAENNPIPYEVPIPAVEAQA